MEAPRVNVNPPECPAAQERLEKGSKSRSDRRSRRGDSTKKEKEDLAYDLFDCNSNVPNAGGKHKSKIPVLPMPGSPDSQGHSNMHSRRSDSRMNEKGPVL